jgi:biotin operon repressor
MDPRGHLKRAADSLVELAESGQLTREQLAQAQAELAMVERELFGPRPRARRGEGAKAKILAYMQNRVGEAVSGEVLRELTGIQEWARRIRELRVEDGYAIIEEDGMYTLVQSAPDGGAAARWDLANRIRRMPGDGRGRILEYFKSNVGDVVSLTELHYVAGIKEVPRRVRELRDEMGFRISSHHDRPELRPDQYVLETLEPTPANERRIKSSTRAEIFIRDDFRCVRCGAVPGPGVWLEVDHIQEKLGGGSDDDLANLQTLCNSCHAGKTARFQRERRNDR